MEGKQWMVGRVVSAVVVASVTAAAAAGLFFVV